MMHLYQVVAYDLGILAALRLSRSSFISGMHDDRTICSTSYAARNVQTEFGNNARACPIEATVMLRLQRHGD